MKCVYRIGRTIVSCLGIVLTLGAAAGSAGATDFAFVTTTDFVTGSSSVVWLDGSYTTVVNAASLHSDAVARYFDGRVYVVNRFGGDNIQVLDPSNAFTTLRQFTVGTSSDPHDIIILSGTKAYVTRYNTTDIWIVNPWTGANTGTVDLAGLADGDGIPEMDQMVRVGNHVFVTIQRLDRNTTWGPEGTSYVAVVDATTDQLVDVDPLTPGDQSIVLTGTNPATDIQLDAWNARLYVSCVGFWGLQDGGVETIDPLTFESQGFIFTEAEAGGDISDVVILSNTKAYAIVTDSNFHTVLIAFNPQTGNKTGTLYAPGDFVLQDIELSPQGRLFLSDRTPTRPGIRIYETDTDTEITTNPIDVGLPPFDITFSVAVQTGLVSHVPKAGWLGQNYPNPFNPSTRIPFSLDREDHVSLTIYDTAGRLVRALLDEPRSAGPHTVTWDGRDTQDRLVSSGVYFVRMESGGSVNTRKLIFIK